MSEAIVDLSQLLEQYRLAVLCESPESGRMAERIREEALRQAEERMERQREEASGWRGLLLQVQDYGRRGMALASQPLQELLSGSGVQTEDTILQQAIRELHQLGLKDYVPAVEAPQPVQSAPASPAPSVNALAPDQREKALKEITLLMIKIMAYRTWDNDRDKMLYLAEAQRQIAKLDAGLGQRAKERLEQGKRIAALQNQAFKMGSNNNQPGLEELIQKAKAEKATGLEIDKINAQFLKGKERNESYRRELHERKRLEAQGKAPVLTLPEFPPEQPHPYALGNLTPAPHWNIYLDETGSLFDQSIFQQETKKTLKGKLAAVLVPAGSALPKLNGLRHATDSSLSSNLRLLTELLEKGRGCGILGVTLEAMPQVDIDYWDAGFERLVDLTFRQLPTTDSLVQLDFMVENRGYDSETGMKETQRKLMRTVESSLYRYAKSYPFKARLINCHVHVEAKRKTTNAQFLAYNGYADLIAYAWNGANTELLNALRKTGLLHRCLLDGDSQELPLVMDRLEHHESVPMRTWNSLLLSPDAAMGDSLVSRLLERQGQLLRQDVDAWTAFVEEVVGHLNSKAISLRLLSRQIDWLAANMPDESQLPGRLRLVWLTSKLAEENHRGRLSPELIGDITMLSRQLFIEDAPLCCWANLHAAVESANAFRFGEARQTVLDYARQAELFSGAATPLEAIRQGIPSHKVAIQGLQYYGQLLSSLGQHEAFLGNSAGALPYLDAALQCYAQMDDRAKSRLDISQTLSYKVICLMDSAADKLSIQKQMEQYLGASLTDSAAKLAVARDDSSKYAHHILLRYLVELPTSHPAVQAYLARQDKWQVGNGHPRELIEFYRALLLENAQQRLAHLDQAAELALSDDSGATLKAIAAVIIRARLGLEANADCSERLNALLETLVLELPDFGPTRLELLSAKNGQTLPPLELARRVLPFNFR